MKPSILQRAVNALWAFSHNPQPRRKSAKPYKIERGFNAGAETRLLAGWSLGNEHINDKLRAGLRNMRNRSRDLYENNEYFKRFGSLAVINVVGPAGFHYKPKAVDDNGKADKADNDYLSRFYKNYSKLGNFEVTGKLSRQDAERLFTNTLVRDGEVLGRYVRGYKNKHKFAIQFLDVALLDERLNRDLADGNTIRLGVELDKWKRPQAYWLLSNRTTDETTSVDGKNYTRVPAADIFHCFMVHYVDQVRGIPWGHAAMIRLNELGAYNEAAVIAARLGASTVGYITGLHSSEEMEDEEDERGNSIMDTEPGTMHVLPENATVHKFDPDYPHAQYPAFHKACLQGISSGIGYGVAYHSLSGDITGINYSSMRGGVLQERDAWMIVQNFVSASFCEPVNHELITYSVRFSGLIKLPPRKLDKFLECEFIPRRWSWVDPQKDIAAEIDAIDNNLKSVSMSLRERGYDPMEVLEEIAADEKIMKRLKIQKNTEGKNASVPKKPEPKPEPEPENAEDDEK